MTSGQPGDLQKEVDELRHRVRRLEQALEHSGIVVGGEPGPAREPEAVQASRVLSPSPTQAMAPQPMAPPAPAPSLPPAPPAYEGATRQPERSLESRIGSQWFNRIGILAVLIGMGWFLKLAIDNHWIGPLGRVLIGVLAGAALIAWSERFRTRGYPAFSYSLKSVGSGILYLSLWASFSLYHLIPGEAAFAAMIAVTAFNGYLSWVQDAELLALYAIAGGFGTPLLVSTGSNHEVALFSYMLLLDLAVLALVVLRPWSRLLFVAFLGTLFYAGGWWIAYYNAEQAWITAFFFACFFLVFALAPRLIRLEGTGSAFADQNSGWDKLATVVLPMLTAALGFVGFYELVTKSHADWAKPWLAVGFAGFYLVLVRLPASGRWQANPVLLSDLHLAAAVVFLTIAIPLKASGRWITMGWLAEGAALLWVASRTRSLLLRALALLCLGLAAMALLILNPTASTTPIFNQRFATYLGAIAAFGVSAWIARRNADVDRDEPRLGWGGIAASTVLAVNALILLAVTLEIHGYWGSRQWHEDARLYSEYKIYAQFSYSAFFMIFGAALLALGFSRHSAFLRWQALVLLAVSVGKVFLIDVSELSQGYRILSFLGLGALLLGVSFIYQRDWLNLRGRGGQTS